MTELAFLQVEPTTRCNFTCGFCCGRAMPQRDLEMETFRQALEALPGLRHLELQGEGEPLLHPHLFDMMDLARERGIKVSLVTNGSLLSERVVARLVEEGVEKVLVSLESPRAEEFARIRGGRWETVVAGVDRLLAARTASGRDRPRVGLAVTVLRDTRDRLPEIVAFYRLHRLDGGIGILQALQRMPGYVSVYGPELEAQMLSSAEEAAFLSAARADPETAALLQAGDKGRGFFDELFEGWTPAGGTCPWLERGAYLSRDGSLTGCCMMKDTERFAFGHVAQPDRGRWLAARADLARTLAEGEVPAACAGCDIAASVVAALPAPEVGGDR